MPLVFIPDRSTLFHWETTGNGAGGVVDAGAAVAAAPTLAMELVARGTRGEADIVIPPGRRARVQGAHIHVSNALPLLAAAAQRVLSDQPASIASFCLAGKFALDLVIRERLVPRVVVRGDRHEARWAAALGSAVDAANLTALARAMPLAAYSVPVTSSGHDVWSAEALLRSFLDHAVDGLVRSAQKRPWAPKIPRWEHRLFRALTDPDDASFEPEGFVERSLLDDLERWVEPALGVADRPRTCFRLELPSETTSARTPPAFQLRFLLQAPDDPSLIVDADDIWSQSQERLAKLGRAFSDPQESLLRSLALAGRLFAPIADSLRESTPSEVSLDAQGAWSFLNEGAAALAQAGFGVIVPSELTQRGQRRLRLRLRLGGTETKTAGVVKGASGLELGSVVSFQWQAAVGAEPLTASELAQLARQKSPIVRHRGLWIAVDPRELAEIRRRLEQSPSGSLDARDALAAALAGDIAVEGLPQSAEVAVTNGFAHVLETLRAAAHPKRVERAPAMLRATLRPYQARGLAWLCTMASVGLGGCLADDMGLGKTVQLLAFLLAREQDRPDDARPILLVAPTSVLGNWEREIERFAPTLSVIRHYGSDRARRVEELADVTREPTRARTAPVVLTSYGVLRRDVELLASVDWATVVLDEAQNIKNAAAATARAARRLRATHRFALTGTPLENRLAELWSILEFSNPGLLGPLERFRREYAVPIERYASESAAERLKRIVQPFVLRRTKNDPNVIRDLPAKNEMKVACTLTREQASLYQAVVDEKLRTIAESEGMKRRGLVLALLSHLKQICNHPAQYLGESGPLAGRSGKLMRLTEMLEEALSAGDKALVFTQFREMGDRLVTHLTRSLRTEIAFLHGGTPKRVRDEMVRRFQEQKSPPVFVLSLRAGGTGLNLTAASHVFHYDRWWNPAVEDQATDRAHRIGQSRSVQVHKLFCAGTVEDRIDRLLEQKRELFTKIVGSGEHWVTELGDAELRELFTLSPDAAVAGDDGSDEDDVQALSGDSPMPGTEAR